MDLKGKICVLIKDIFAISENRLMNHCDLIIGSNTPYVKLIILIKSIAFSYRRCSQIDANFLMRVLRTSLWCDLLIEDRKSTRLNSSHVPISYAVFCSKKTTSNDHCCSCN